jgi:hypothetical protein
MKFKIGDKVVPISKSFGKPFEECIFWKKAISLNQNFLYINEINCKRTYEIYYTCGTIKDEMTGNFYSETDLIKYKEFKNEIVMKFQFENESL